MGKSLRQGRRGPGASTAAPVRAAGLGPRRRRAERLFQILHAHYPQAKCALAHHNPFDLLVATILSAQCTDARVNKVTPALFERYPTAEAMAQARVEELQALIRTTGFFRNKAMALQAASRHIVRQHGGSVPDTMEKLLELRGVARKTANVVLGNAFGKSEGVVVDTHVARLSKRLGFSGHTDPGKIEVDLMELFEPRQWTLLAHLLIFHGRSLCLARGPRCPQCPVRRLCPRTGVAEVGAEARGA
jgi:endonuclease-3